MMSTKFAREAGYTGNSPALLGAYEAIRQAGIREARAGHFARKQIIEQFKAEPSMFFAAIRPALCTAEAIEDAERFLIDFRNMPTWRQELRARQAGKAKQTRLVARYFRRYGLRIWAREAA